ncbi:MAG: flagellar assembly protein FliH [Azoarcus sp.]|jgi:flagellar assembly protein FliH|nr:flagellar assembly protein FliH [Azoarcus sp.]
MNKPVPFARHQAVGAYRRWEPPNFDAPPEPEPAPLPETGGEGEGGGGGAPAAEPQAEIVELPPGFSLPTAAEIEAIHEEARRAGYEEGLAEGRETGYADGRRAGHEQGHAAGYDEGRAASEAEAKRLHELVRQLEDAFARLDAEVAEELMSLAIELARKVLQHTLAVEPEAVVNVVRAALQSLPETHAQVFLNPADAALTSKHLGEMIAQGGHLIVEDGGVSPGGCRIETSSAQIDASMETRWRRVLDSLGREHAPWTGLAQAAPAEKPKKARAATARTRKKAPVAAAEGEAAPPPASDETADAAAPPPPEPVP